MKITRSAEFLAPRISAKRSASTRKICTTTDIEEVVRDLDARLVEAKNAINAAFANFDGVRDICTLDALHRS